MTAASVLPGTDVPLPVVGAPRFVTVIDLDTCIGCTKCIRACPFDAIAGAMKHRHHVLAEHCTGCGLCAVPCPVDCISTVGLPSQWDVAAVARATARALRRRARQADAAQPVDDAATAPRHGLSEPDERARRLAAILAAARDRGRGRSRDT